MRIDVGRAHVVIGRHLLIEPLGGAGLMLAVLCLQAVLGVPVPLTAYAAAPLQAAALVLLEAVAHEGAHAIAALALQRGKVVVVLAHRTEVRFDIKPLGRTVVLGVAVAGPVVTAALLVWAIAAMFDHDTVASLARDPRAVAILFFMVSLIQSVIGEGGDVRLARRH